MVDLITVNEYKDAEGLRGEKDDDRLNVIVPQVSDLVKKYCGISFVDFCIRLISYEYIITSVY